MGRRGRPPGRTAQGDATREALYDAAIRRFAEDGFEGASVRRIAGDVGVTAAAMYRHFPSKQAVVLELYARLSSRFAAECRFSGSRWPDRFVEALKFSLETLSPHRDTLRAVLGELLVGEANLLDAVDSRERVRSVFVEAVTGSTNAPSSGATLGRVLYLVHLGVLLLWCLDRSVDQGATARSITFLEGFGRPLGVLFGLPGSGVVLERVENLLGAALFGQGEATTAQVPR